MSDYISRQAAIEKRSPQERLIIAKTLIESVLNELPSAQSERKTGKWICWYEEIENDTCTEYIPHCKCSECGTEYDPHTVKFINFCSYCGAKMQLSNEDHSCDGGCDDGWVFDEKEELKIKGEES